MLFRVMKFYALAAFLAALWFCGVVSAEVPAEWTAKIEAVAPSEPVVEPRAERRALIFSLTTGFVHEVAPFTTEVMRILGENTGAYSLTISNDVAMFEPDNIAEFDLVILNNNSSQSPRRNLFMDVLEDEEKAAALEQSLIDHIARGNGLVVLHGGIVMQNNSLEFSRMVAGSFDFHPPNQRIVLEPVDPDHPLLASFEGEPFVYRDEPYVLKNAYNDFNFRPLLKMRLDGLNLGARAAEIRSKPRYMAWIKRHGEGRVFFCSPSHNKESYERPELLQFILAGTQYALGDLDCDDSPLHSDPSARLDNDAVISYEKCAQDGLLTVSVDGSEIFVYRHGEEVDLTHFHPLRCPAGESMLIDKTEPFPHHRAFWFADKVRRPGGPAAAIYDALYSGVDRQNPPYRNRVKHIEFEQIEAKGNVLNYTEKLVWIINHDEPVLDERRTVRVTALGEGEYLIDIRFKVIAAHGDIEFVSDWVHYAWPYLRMNPAFSVDSGGRMVSSEGGVNQDGTNNRVADWIDYSNTSGGLNAGLTLMSHPENDKPHRWLTRNYGTFGPRRVDARSGRQFTLRSGDTKSRRVGVLVHSGDHLKSRVAAWYATYAESELP